MWRSLHGREIISMRSAEIWESNTQQIQYQESTSNGSEQREEAQLRHSTGIPKRNFPCRKQGGIGWTTRFVLFVGFFEALWQWYLWKSEIRNGCDCSSSIYAEFWGNGVRFLLYGTGVRDIRHDVFSDGKLLLQRTPPELKSPQIIQYSEQVLKGKDTFISLES